MLKTLKRVAITIGSAFVSFWFLCIWTVIFAVTGVLMLIDWIHKVWTDRRIPWIVVVMDGWADLFDHPFTRKTED